MKPITLVPPLSLVIVLAALAAPAHPPVAGAAPLGNSIPAGCVEHTGFGATPEAPDVPGDYRCAGLAIPFHTSGAAASPGPVWAGQWLFTDEAGQYRVGTCTYQRGLHPTVAVRSHPTAQHLPNDPTGTRSAYLAWKYGDTTDDLTAAAMWAVMHYYAQDAAGTHRSTDPAAPLVASLDGLAAATGRADLQARALALAQEADVLGGEWTLTATFAAGTPATGTPAAGTGQLLVTLRSGTTPVPGRPISVLVSGSDLPLAATTGTDGTTTVAVPFPPSGTVTVVATTPAPGPAVVYAGTPVAPHPAGVQTLLTGGAPFTLRATARWEAPPTTTVPPSTTVPPTTDPVATTSTVAPTSTTVVPTLPSTGGRGDGGIAHLATALLVGGIGLLGTLRRREAPFTPPRVDSGG